MSLREEMHSLGQEIIGSYEARVAGLSALRAATAAQLQAAQAQLQECDRAHQAMARQLRTDLAQSEAQRSSEVNAWIKDVAAAHQAMAQQLRADLAQGEKERSSGVQAWLADTASAHQAMAQQQRESLAQNEARRSDEVSVWLREVATARAAGHAEWQRMEETLQARRAHAPAEEAVARVPVGPRIPGFASLRSRAFEYLANRPDGTRLAELERALGVNPVQVARVVRSLLEEGKAEKRGLLYYAI